MYSTDLRVDCLDWIRVPIPGSIKQELCQSLYQSFTQPLLQCPPIPLDAYTPMPPYTPCLYAPSVEHKLTGPLASGVQSGAPVGRIMLSLPSNYHLDTLLHSFLSVFVAKADQFMGQKLLNSSPRSFNNGSSSYYLWPP